MNEDEIRKELEKLENQIEDIKSNHLDSIYTAIKLCMRDINHLRWFIMAGTAVLGIVIALVELLG
ncbi:MAG: hypothetical protein DRZ76_03490 [Candidatus Nealsonbacteria bacterium]|nr:MAG: hypothetical protein DRZ76_03490 [Candidatus Nealsonbacteria bacterium]